jgi:energy-coupling factor transport system ATP-binding protein
LQAAHLGFQINGRKILEDINLDFFPGCCTALVGPNGAGKTTLLKLFAGLLRPSAGQILIHGKPIAKRPAWEIARYLGMAFQNPNSQFFKLNVHDEILAGPMALNCYDAEWYDQLVSLFKLDHLLQKSPFKLSGGEKKRVAFAAALAAKPAVLALDEPTAGQDCRFRQALIRGLEQLQSQGTSIIIVTHALSFAQELSEDWAIMSNGRLLARGQPMQLMADIELMQQAALEPTEAFQLREKCTPGPPN